MLGQIEPNYDEGEGIENVDNEPSGHLINRCDKVEMIYCSSSFTLEIINGLIRAFQL